MTSSWTTSEAVDYLAGKIVSTAEREGIHLSEVERKMLSFSASAPMSQETELMREEFNRHYDPDEYEQKIASLVHKIKAGFTPHNELEKVAWFEAVDKLNEEDCYLRSLVHSLPASEEESSFPQPEKSKRWITVLACVLVGLALLLLADWYFGPAWGNPWR